MDNQESTQFLKLVGGNIKIPIRTEPTSQGAVKKYLLPDEYVEVKVTNSKNFYRLADGLVSFQYIHIYLYNIMEFVIIGKIFYVGLHQ